MNFDTHLVQAALFSLCIVGIILAVLGWLVDPTTKRDTADFREFDDTKY